VRGQRRRASTAAIILAMVSSSAAAVAATQSPAAASPSIKITSPVTGGSVDGSRFSVEGTFAASDTDGVNVIYVVDVSGSTTSPDRQDCNGDGTSNSFDDFNSADGIGDTLDCEISGVIALNASIRNRTNVRVALVPFGSSASAANLNGTPGGAEEVFVRPSDDRDNDRSATADVVQAAASMRQGQITLFSSRTVGTGTDFDRAVTEMLRVKGLGPFGRTVAFFLSDGESSVTSSTLSSLTSSGAEVRTYAIGSGTGCQANGPLDRIAKATGQSCTTVANPAALQGVLGSGSPDELDRIEVTVENSGTKTATVDALGNWDVEFTGVGAGVRRITATAFLKNGTTVSDSVSVTFGQPGHTYVALGDSFSAGEGIEPFLNGSFDAVCRRSQKGYPRLVKLPGENQPISSDPEDGPLMRFVACSGAVISNFDANPQHAGIELQVRALGPDVDLVTVTLGGNDAGFSEIIGHCVTQLDCQNDGFARLSSGRELRLAEWVDVRLRLLQNELVELYRSVLDETDRNARVIVLTYPRLMKQGFRLRLGCKEGLALGPKERDFLSDIIVNFGTRIETAAGQAGIASINVIDRFRGHEICSGGINDNDEWIVGHETAWRDKLTGQGSFHPNEKGAQAYAQLINEYLAANPTTSASALAPSAQERQDATPRASTAAVVQGPAATFRAQQPGPALTDAELAEVAAMQVGYPDLASISAIKDPATPCPATAVPSQQLALVGKGFAPGSSVRLSFKISNEDAGRPFPALTADGSGTVSAWVVVPADASGVPTEPEATDEAGTKVVGARVQLDGTSPQGAQRRLLQWFYLDPADSECGLFARDTGQLSNGQQLAPGSGGTGFTAPLVTTPTQSGNRGGNGIVFGAIDSNRDSVPDTTVLATARAGTGGQPEEAGLRIIGQAFQFTASSFVAAAFTVDGDRRALLLTGTGSAGGETRLFRARVEATGSGFFGFAPSPQIALCVYQPGQSCAADEPGVFFFDGPLAGLASITPAAS
jgi:lysophospholipase L1-like esterase